MEKAPFQKCKVVQSQKCLRLDYDTDFTQLCGTMDGNNNINSIYKDTGSFPWAGRSYQMYLTFVDPKNSHVLIDKLTMQIPYSTTAREASEIGKANGKYD